MRSIWLSPLPPWKEMEDSVLGGRWTVTFHPVRLSWGAEFRLHAFTVMEVVRLSATCWTHCSYMVRRSSLPPSATTSAVVWSTLLGRRRSNSRCGCRSLTHNWNHSNWPIVWLNIYRPMRSSFAYLLIITSDYRLGISLLVWKCQWKYEWMLLSKGILLIVLLLFRQTQSCDLINLDYYLSILQSIQLFYIRVCWLVCNRKEILNE